MRNEHRGRGSCSNAMWLKVASQLNAQQDDGSWACYWWFEPAYAAALAVKALAVAGGSPALQAIERAMSWARSRTHALHKKPTPFELAWLLRILLLDGGLSAEASHCLDPGPR
jgi:hypothetical protein